MPLSVFLTVYIMFIERCNNNNVHVYILIEVVAVVQKTQYSIRQMKYAVRMQSIHIGKIR